MAGFISLLLLCAAVCQAMTWEEFKSTYNRSYESAADEALRKAVFLQNVDLIESHNANADKSFTMGMNEFGDMSAKEFASKMLKRPVDSYEYDGNALGNGVGIPASEDWRSSGCVGPVRDQGQCGASWAIVTTNIVAAYQCLKHRPLVALSTQDLIDCTPGSQGCNGGTLAAALQYCVDEGIDTAASYPDTGSFGTCKHKQGVVGAQCDKWTKITPPGNETGLTEVLGNTGPVACAIDASRPSFQFYQSGVYDDKMCSAAQLDHVILNVGYGTEAGKDYYILQNSWGTSWGQSGYILLARNKNNMCGIASDAVWVTVK